MEVCWRASWLSFSLIFVLFVFSLQGVQGETDPEGPSETECRPYIEKALKELEEGGDSEDVSSPPLNIEANGGDEVPSSIEETTTAATNSDHPLEEGSRENDSADNIQRGETNDRNISNDSNEDDNNHPGSNDDDDENITNSDEHNINERDTLIAYSSNEIAEDDIVNDGSSREEHLNEDNEEENTSQPSAMEKEESDEKDGQTSNHNSEEDTGEKSKEEDNVISNNGEQTEDTNENTSTDLNDEKVVEDSADSAELESMIATNDNRVEDEDESAKEARNVVEELTDDDEDEEYQGERRIRQHVEHLLKLDANSTDVEEIIERISEITLRELKKLYENAIQPLETLYKYRDLSNRHFGDSEIYSKPLILFMGPWSGGKSSIINYLINNEYSETSLRTGAEPSPAYFNILMWGNESEVLDGTELAADFTFSGLQKFGQGLEERLRGYKLPMRLLEKVNIVEIPGILEVRKLVSRVFPFNDACQWFIDRADVIFLVYDPSKLDVGPETEAILDQLKGREQHTRIILNKADQVKPEELMRVQGALIWNISPLMSSPQPPVMYTTSLWSRPYETWAPVRLLNAQERSFLRDIRSTIDKRIENKIASARRFAVRVRNHAKMVDCYLTTYYNHKTVFGNKKQIANEIIDNPQDYHIYEGLSTLTNISRYDLPDPDVYREFFKLNPLYEFQQLSATCTYFRGCPINRLDIAIAYDLPELLGKHKRLLEGALNEAATAAAAARS